MTVLDRLGSVAFALLWAAVSVGLFIALVRVSLGLRDGHRHLIGVVVVAAALVLWQAGVLSVLIQSLTTQVSGGGTGPSSPGVAAPR